MLGARLLIFLTSAASFANGRSFSRQVDNSEPCATIATILQQFVASGESGLPNYPAATALACLQSVPLSQQIDLDFLTYIGPFIEFQSNLAYLKNPPKGYTLPGVDVLEGLSTIKQNLQSGKYKTQWDFEQDVYTLINVLPHDFHFNLDLPLLRLFQFQSRVDLISVSADGVQLPQPYFYTDLLKLQAAASSSTAKPFTPSPLVKINGEVVTDHLLRIAQQTSVYQDPDTQYNNLFFSLPSASQGLTSQFFFAAYKFGFPSQNMTYTFANGTSLVEQNIARSAFDFTGVTDGETLFSSYEVRPNKTTPAPPSTTTTSAVTSLTGYPDPEIIQPEGYTSGYFLNDGETAVLALQAFTSSDETDTASNGRQQLAIQEFLAACTNSSMKKLIIDLSGNGGGSVFNGIDAFKQLFPDLQPFGATRYRYTESMNFFGTVYSTAAVHNASFATNYQIQGNLDINLNHFDNWADLAGPVEIYGDNFTNLIRTDLTDAVQQIANGVIVSGYLNNTDIAPQAFTADNMVLLYDGTCGSTCAIFSELVKSQGNVRSVVVGGRPKTGPMQGVAGSKGAQVLDYNSITFLDIALPVAKEIYTQDGDQFPTIPSLPDSNPPVLNSVLSGNRFNLRNNYNDANVSDLPLQFVYEASNCRLFYQAEDFIDMTSLWARVANVTWGNGVCVDGSSINSDGTMPLNANDTVPFGADAMSNVTLPDTVGLVQPGQSTTSTSSTPSVTGPTKKGNANTIGLSYLSCISICAAMLFLM